MITVKAPNLPQNAAVILIGEKYAEKFRKSFNFLNISPVFVPDNPYVDSRLAGHADLSILHMGGEELWLAPYLKNTCFSSKLEARGFHIHYPEIVQSPNYPDDAQLNQCICGQNALLGKKTVSSEIADYLTNLCHCHIVGVNQGYVRCSVCVVSEDAIITADRGIAEAAKSLGIEALLISSGYVKLPGFAHGFIGGASFKISKHQMAFTGRLDQHPDKQDILDFLRKHDVEPIFLTDEPIFDIGSGIPITEKNNPF